MSAKPDIDHLRDTLEYSELATGLLESRSLDEMDTDRTFRYALQYCILIVGEAATQVSQETRDRMPTIPWRQIVGMRNWLVHGYSKYSRSDGLGYRGTRFAQTD